VHQAQRVGQAGAGDGVHHPAADGGQVVLGKLVAADHGRQLPGREGVEVTEGNDGPVGPGDHREQAAELPPFQVPLGAVKHRPEVHREEGDDAAVRHLKPDLEHRAEHGPAVTAVDPHGPRRPLGQDHEVLIQRLAVPGVLLAVGPAPHREHPEFPRQQHHPLERVDLLAGQHVGIDRPHHVDEMPEAVARGVQHVVGHDPQSAHELASDL
jgi:hypothetical protein